MEIDVRKTALVKYCAMIIGSAHWLGCIWWSLAQHRNFDDKTWVWHYSYSFLSPNLSLLNETATDSKSTVSNRNDNLDAYISEGGVAEFFSLYHLDSTRSQYLLCVYWGFQSLTNLGYSDLIPDNPPEMVLGFILCVYQVAFYAYILGTLFSYVVKKDEHVEQYRKR